MRGRGYTRDALARTWGRDEQPVFFFMIYPQRGRMGRIKVNETAAVAAATEYTQAYPNANSHHTHLMEAPRKTGDGDREYGLTTAFAYLPICLSIPSQPVNRAPRSPPAAATPIHPSGKQTDKSPSRPVSPKARASHAAPRRGGHRRGRGKKRRKRNRMMI